MVELGGGESKEALVSSEEGREGRGELITSGLIGGYCVGNWLF